MQVLNIILRLKGFRRLRTIDDLPLKQPLLCRVVYEGKRETIEKVFYAKLIVKVDAMFPFWRSFRYANDEIGEAPPLGYMCRVTHYKIAH